MTESNDVLEEITNVGLRSKRPLNTVSLASGYGGLELGCRTLLHTRTILYVEVELTVSSILVNLMEQGLLDKAPIWSDIRSIPYELLGNGLVQVDLLTAGFPCQPFSLAGNRRGADDERNLWPEVARFIERIRPTVVLLENVPGILPYYFDTIRPRLSEMAYTVAEGLFSAEEVGAPHRRERLFILAYTEHDGRTATEV